MTSRIVLSMISLTLLTVCGSAQQQIPTVTKSHPVEEVKAVNLGEIGTDHSEQLLQFDWDADDPEQITVHLLVGEDAEASFERLIVQIGATSNFSITPTLRPSSAGGDCHETDFAAVCHGSVRAGYYQFELRRSPHQENTIKILARLEEKMEHSPFPMPD